ncbi:MAG: hypothetical protein WCB96_03550 [Candidatus Aminicenantales bacterium]
MKVRVLTESQIRGLIDWPEAVEAVEKSLAAYSSGKVISPEVVNLDLPRFEGEVHIKSAYLPGEEFYVIKAASGFYRNPDLGLPVGNGLMLVFEAKTGRPLGILFDNGYLTEMRTGAAGAVAAKHLAKKTISIAGLIGAGTQARFQLRALMEVRKPAEVRVWSRDPSHAQAFIKEMKPACAAEYISVGSPAEAVGGADLVITVTPSRAPLVKASWLKKGVHLTAVGSDGPEKQELEPEVLAAADLIYCDSVKQCSRLGEVHHALEKKIITRGKISGELGDIILGRKPGRFDDEQITVADLTGLGAQDAAAAALIYRKALSSGVGTVIEI